MDTRDDTGIIEPPVAQTPAGTPGLVVPILFGLLGAWWASSKASRLGVSDTKRYWIAAAVSSGVMLLVSILVPMLLISAISASMDGVTPSTAIEEPAVKAPLSGKFRLTLTPVAKGSEQITPEGIAESIRILRKRLDSSGVSGSEITSQGGINIVVVTPRKPDQATMDLVRKRGVMRFRVVLVTTPTQPSIPVPTSTGLAISKPGATGQATTASNSGIPPALAAPKTSAPSAAPMTVGQPANASDLTWVTPLLEAKLAALDCSNSKKVEAIVDDPAKPLVVCDTERQFKYILGPAEVLGSEVSSATSGQQMTQGGVPSQTEVRLDFNAAGTKSFCDMTSRILSLPSPRNQFGIVLDNQIISAPAAQAPLCAGSAQITGNFTTASAKMLADQINFGSLPFMFEVQTQE